MSINSVIDPRGEWSLRVKDIGLFVLSFWVVEIWSYTYIWKTLPWTTSWRIQRIKNDAENEVTWASGKSGGATAWADKENLTYNAEF